MEKLKLAEDIEKHLRTTFIGAIAAVERHMDFLWGGDKPYEELTENQKKYKKLWQSLRTEILDFGNHQMRNLLRKLENREYD